MSFLPRFAVNAQTHCKGSNEWSLCNHSRWTSVNNKERSLTLGLIFYLTRSPFQASTLDSFGKETNNITLGSLGQVSHLDCKVRSVSLDEFHLGRITWKYDQQKERTYEFLTYCISNITKKEEHIYNTKSLLMALIPSRDTMQSLRPSRSEERSWRQAWRTEPPLGVNDVCQAWLGRIGSMDAVREAMSEVHVIKMNKQQQRKGLTLLSSLHTSSNPRFSKYPIMIVKQAIARRWGILPGISFTLPKELLRHVSNCTTKWPQTSPHDGAEHPWWHMIPPFSSWRFSKSITDERRLGLVLTCCPSFWVTRANAFRALPLALFRDGIMLMLMCWCTVAM